MCSLDRIRKFDFDFFVPLRSEQFCPKQTHRRRSGCGDAVLPGRTAPSSCLLAEQHRYVHDVLQGMRGGKNSGFIEEWLNDCKDFFLDDVMLTAHHLMAMNLYLILIHDVTCNCP